MEGRWAVRRRAFFESGAFGFALQLLAFVLVSSFVLSVGAEADEQQGSWHGFGWKAFFLNGSVMLILSVALGLYIAANERRVVQNHLRSSLLFGMLVIMFTIVRLGAVQGWQPYLTVVPVMITGIIVTTAYNQRFALGVSSFLSLISILAMADVLESLAQGLGVLLASGTGAGIAVLLLRKIRSFTKLIEVCSFAAVIVFVLILVMGLWRRQAVGEILIDCFYGALGALAVGFLMQGILPLTERLFRTATDMTLLSYGEATTPLLKRLAVEAPGTFNHSWQIGMMSEAAAEAVGANGLLCRVGSYYHDVGKINKPRYFVENQEENFNQHKELSPTMSRMIIVGHVKDGMELMREYKIPRVLRQFTETHHGTTLVEYFYHEAVKKGAAIDKKVSESEFRYPGPKPATTEAAIVMLADAVEGATRAMEEPTPSRVEAVVHNMSMKRLQDGQFNQCDLTMRQLNIIEESLTKSLCAMYHGRITYPKTEKMTKRKIKD